MISVQTQIEIQRDLNLPKYPKSYNLKSQRIKYISLFNLGNIIMTLFEGHFSINDCKHVF